MSKLFATKDGGRRSVLVIPSDNTATQLCRSVKLHEVRS